MQGLGGRGPALGASGRGAKGLFQDSEGNLAASLTIGAGGFIDRAGAFQGEERLNLAHDLATGGVGLKNLPNPAPEGAKQGKDALPAVILSLARVEEAGGKGGSEAGLDLGEGGTAKLVGKGLGGTHGSQPVAPSGKEGGLGHNRAVCVPPY